MSGSHRDYDHIGGLFGGPARSSGTAPPDLDPMSFDVDELRAALLSASTEIGLWDWGVRPAVRAMEAEGWLVPRLVTETIRGWHITELGRLELSAMQGTESP